MNMIDLISDDEEEANQNVKKVTKDVGNVADQSQSIKKIDRCIS